MRGALALLLVLALAGCAAPQAHRAPVMTASAVLADPATIAVTLYDLPPGANLEAVVLIGADGSETPAGAVSQSYREAGPGYGPTGIGVAISGGSASGVSTGVTAGVNSSGGRGVEAGTRLATAIAIPDPARYAEDPRAWQVEVRWTDVAGGARVIRLPAPRT